MHKKLLMLAVALMYIASFVGALQISDVSQGIQENSSQITQLKAETTAKLQQISDKIDKFATKEDVQSLLEGHLIVMQQELNFFKTSLIISFIISSLCLLGLGYSVLFFFKSRRRI